MRQRWWNGGGRMFTGLGQRLRARTLRSLALRHSRSLTMPSPANPSFRQRLDALSQRRRRPLELDGLHSRSVSLSSSCSQSTRPITAATRNGGLRCWPSATNTVLPHCARVACGSSAGGGNGSTQSQRTRTLCQQSVGSKGYRRWCGAFLVVTRRVSDQEDYKGEPGT